MAAEVGSLPTDAKELLDFVHATFVEIPVPSALVYRALVSAKIVVLGALAAFLLVASGSVGTLAFVDMRGARASEIRSEAAVSAKPVPCLPDTDASVAAAAAPALAGPTPALAFDAGAITDAGVNHAARDGGVDGGLRPRRKVPLTGRPPRPPVGTPTGEPASEPGPPPVVPDRDNF